MKKLERPEKSAARERGQRAESLLAGIFENARWRVERQPDGHEAAPDMVSQEQEGCCVYG